MTKNTTPLLLCIPENRIGQVLEDLHDFNKSVHGTKFNKPDYLEDKIEAHYDYQGEPLDEIQNEMSKAPSRSRG